MDDTIIFYVIMIVIWGIVICRNLLFNFIVVFFIVGEPYKKSIMVDIGITIMFLSVIIGVTVFSLIETLPLDLVAPVIVIGLCIGGGIVAMNVGDERRQNGL